MSAAGTWTGNRTVEVSVILSTCQDPVCLEKAAWGYFKQSYQDFELLIADDGLQPDAAEVQRLRRETGLTIRRVGHGSQGEPKCAALNRAIEAAAGDYLVFSEDRCIPRWDFLESHVRLARPSRFLCGWSVSLPAPLSRRIAVEDVVAGRATDPHWLRAEGLLRDERSGILRCGPWRAWLADNLPGLSPVWNSANASVWKADLLAVNGFDERVAHGALDRELGERLANAGVRAKRVGHQAVCVQLYVPHRYLRREALERNLSLSRESRRTRATWTPFGIRKGFRVLGVEPATHPAEPGDQRRAVA